MEQFKKLSENEIGTAIEKSEDITQYLLDSVKRYYIGTMSDLSAEFEWCLANCESPIEQIMAIALEDFKRRNKFDIPLLVDVIGIENQYEVVCGDKTYRADFAIYVRYWDNHETVYIVECDGHSFHQKTKEQVERDNQRMRDLQRAGYTVIRFSGTEIYHKPYHCAREVKNIIQAPALEFLRRMLNGSEQSQ